MPQLAYTYSERLSICRFTEHRVADRDWHDADVEALREIANQDYRRRRDPEFRVFWRHCLFYAGSPEALGAIAAVAAPDTLLRAEHRRTKHESLMGGAFDHDEYELQCDSADLGAVRLCEMHCASPVDPPDAALPHQITEAAHHLRRTRLVTYAFLNGHCWRLAPADRVLDLADLRVALLEAERRWYRRLDRKKLVVSNKADSEDTGRRDRIPEDVRVFVWRRDEGKCARCGSRENLEFDHIVPVAMGGGNTARNIELLCEACNRSKGSDLA